MNTTEERETDCHLGQSMDIHGDVIYGDLRNGGFADPGD